jgi:hypothetical protein
MKKVFLFVMFFCFTLITFAKNETSLKEVHSTEINSKVLLESNSAISIVYFENNTESLSLKCWAVKKWVKHKLSQVSDNDELIEETASAIKELCEIAVDLGIY